MYGNLETVGDKSNIPTYFHKYLANYDHVDDLIIKIQYLSSSVHSKIIFLPVSVRTKYNSSVSYFMEMYVECDLTFSVFPSLMKTKQKLFR